MGALSKHYTLEDTLTRCFHVGIDMILVHSRYSIEELIDTVVLLVKKGIIPEQQIDEGAFRVLESKKRYIWKS
jgi:beta-glucosidase-like glycosyl hydrolase